MILWLTDMHVEVPFPPKSRSGVILVFGFSCWVLVLDVLHLRLTACHLSFVLAFVCVFTR